MSDVGENKRRDVDVRASEIKYRTLVEMTGTGYLILDSQGLVQDANREYVRLSGHAELADIVGRSVLEWTAESSKQKNADAVAQCIKNGLIRDFVTEYSGGSGRNTTVEINATVEGAGESLRIVSLCRDITGRRQAEEALGYKTALLEAQLNSTIDGILIVDAQGKKILQNQRTVDLWKIPRHIADNSNDETQVQHVMHMTRNPAQFVEKVLYLYHHPGETSRDEVELTDGTILDRYSAPVVGVNGQNYGRIWIFRDITGHKQAEAALRRSEAELKRLNELLEDRVKARTANLYAVNAELESFIYTVSHDLRSPMQTMAGFSEALLEDHGSKLDGEGVKYLRYMHDGTIRMRAMLDALLEVSRAGRAELVRENLDISMMARKIFSELADRHPERSVKCCVADNMAGSGDERLVRKLLADLLDNAWKFTRGTEGATIEVGVVEGKGEKIFFVRDNGIGFDMQHVDSLFKPFKRLCSKNDFEGIGIGLVTAKRLVGRHGGRIWAECKPGSGATFYFTLE